MSIRKENFIKNRRKYGLCSSWAIWNSVNNNLLFPMTNVSVFNDVLIELNEKEPTKELLNRLNDRVVLIGLNFSKRDESKRISINVSKYKYYRCFHEEYHIFDKGYTSDPRLEEICKSIKFLSGSYMTDFLKWNFKDTNKPTGIIESNGNSATQQVKKNNKLLEIQISKLVLELKELGIINPTLVCMGKPVFSFIKKEINQFKSALGNETKAIQITHYGKASGLSLEDYVKKVKEELHQEGIK